MKALYIAIIFCFGVIVWVGQSAGTTHPEITQTIDQKLNETLENESRATELQHENQSNESRIKELKAQIIEHGKKFVDATTPTTNELVISVRMKRREPRCRELLESWDVNESDIQEIFSIMRDRERDLLKKRHLMYTKGISGIKDYKLDEITAKGVTSFRIEQLLGPTRAAEFSILEQAIDSDRGTAAGKRVSD